MGKTIGVISLKGGVGKTSVALSLGAALAGFGKKVLIVDGNLSAPNLGMHMNVVEPARTLHHVLAGEANPREAVCEMDSFDILPASIFYKSKISPLKLKNKLGHLKRYYDFVVLDSSPALNEETLAVMNAADELIVVTTPDVPTLSTTLKASKFARNRGAPIIGLVLNKVHKKNFEISLDDVEDTIGIPVMAVVPYDINILKALSEFVPSVVHKPNSEASSEFKHLAATLSGEKYKPLKMKRFFRWVNPKKQDVNRLVFYKQVFE